MSDKTETNKVVSKATNVGSDWTRNLTQLTPHGKVATQIGTKGKNEEVEYIYASFGEEKPTLKIDRDSMYVNEDKVTTQKELKEIKKNNEHFIKMYATKSEIETSLGNYATKEEVSEIETSLGNYATKEEVSEIETSLGNYATKEEVNVSFQGHSHKEYATKIEVKDEYISKDVYNKHLHKDHHPYVGEPLTITINGDTLGFNSNTRIGYAVEKSKVSNSLQGKQASDFWDKNEMKIQTYNINGYSGDTGAKYFCTVEHKGNYSTIHLCCDSIRVSSTGTGTVNFKLPFGIKDWKSVSGLVYRVWQDGQYSYNNWKCGNFGSTISCSGNTVTVTIQNNNTSTNVEWIGYTCILFVERG